MKINALYLTVFTAYKIGHLINETGIKLKQTFIYNVDSNNL